MIIWKAFVEQLLSIRPYVHYSSSAVTSTSWFDWSLARRFPLCHYISYLNVGAGTNELRIAMKVVYLWGIGSTGRGWKSGRERKKAIKGELSSQSSSWANGASVQFSHSVMSDSLWPHELQQARLPIYHQLLEFTQTHVHGVGDAIQPSHPLSSPSPALLTRWPKYWSFSFSISPSNEHPGLISFRMDWLVLRAVQGTLKSLLQHHSLKASIFWCSAFFIVQLSHPYMITGKTIALTRWTFVGKGMSLLFNMLSSLVIAFLPRSKRLLISWLQSPSAVILEPKK